MKDESVTLPYPVCKTVRKIGQPKSAEKSHITPIFRSLVFYKMIQKTLQKTVYLVIYLQRPAKALSFLLIYQLN